jgi:hypothetical protein
VNLSSQLKQAVYLPLVRECRTNAGVIRPLERVLRVARDLDSEIWWEIALSIGEDE